MDDRRYKFTRLDQVKYVKATDLANALYSAGLDWSFASQGWTYELTLRVTRQPCRYGLKVKSD